MSANLALMPATCMIIVYDHSVPELNEPRRHERHAHGCQPRDNPQRALTPAQGRQDSMCAENIERRQNEAVHGAFSKPVLPQVECVVPAQRRNHQCFCLIHPMQNALGVTRMSCWSSSQATHASCTVVERAMLSGKHTCCLLSDMDARG